jgi:hypothetical protein
VGKDNEINKQLDWVRNKNHQLYQKWMNSFSKGYKMQPFDDHNNVRM